MERFRGFPRDMPDFLFSLRFRNTTGSQEVNLVSYRRLITEPLTQLFEALLPAVRGVGRDFEDRPARCVSTPFTDRRFSRDTPLKEYMYIRFRKRGLTENIPGLYFDMGMDDYSYGLRIYKQNARGMDELRGKVSASPDKFSAVLDRAAGRGFHILGDRYKTDHCPLLPPCSAKDLYNHRSFYVGKVVPVNEAVFTEALADEIARGFTDLRELIRLIG